MAYDENKLPIDEIEEALSDNYTGEGVDVFDSYDGEDEIIEQYDGEAASEEMEVYEDYDGEEDDMLDYTGGKLTEDALKKSTKRETFTIENKTDKQLVIAINPASFPTNRVVEVKDDGSGNPVYPTLGGATLPATGKSIGDLFLEYNNPEELVKAGINVDTVLDDGIIYANSTSQYLKVTSAKPEGSIRHWLNYIKYNPVYVAALHISSDNTALFESGIELKKISPFFIFGEDRIPFQDAFRPDNYNVKKIVVEKGFRLDANTVAILTVPANTTATFTFVIGAEMNAGKALVKKIERAVKQQPRRRRWRIVRRHRWGRPLRRFFRRRHR